MPPEPTTRPSSRIEPRTAWTVLTEAPLKGFCMAREAGTLLAWDEANQLYLIDLRGDFRSVTRAPGKITSAAVSDDGSRVALLGEGARLWLLDADLGTVAERQSPPDPLALTIDPHGRYVLVTSRIGFNQFYNRHGKPAGKFELNQPLAFAVFVPDRPVLIAAASYGMLTGIDLHAAGGKLSAEEDWEDRGITSVGRLTTSGDGGIILASCFTHGVHRYDLTGHNEGSYHLGGTAVHAVPDFAGRVMAVATLEGELAVLNSAGNVRWKTGLPRPITALETDPLGNFLIYGHATGEIVRLDLYGGGDGIFNPAVAAPHTGKAQKSAGRSHVGPAPVTVRQPAWSIPVADSETQAETSVLAVLDEPSRVAVFSSSLRLQLFSADGTNLGHAQEVQGVGRIIRTSPGWIAAATDRQIILYNANKNVAQRIDLSLVEMTHLALRPDTFGLAIVQERDRVSRGTVAGRWIWKQELRTAVEDLAIGTDGFCGVTTEDGSFLIFNPAGNEAGIYRADPTEPLSLIEAPEGSPPAVAWLTLARQSQVLRGHDRFGSVLWESPVAWEGWQFQRLGQVALISAPDGRALAYDGTGHLRSQGRASDGGSKDLFAANERGEPRRISGQGVHLICADLDGRVRWRSICPEEIGPVAVGRAGVAAMIGRSLTWFPGLDG